MTVLNAQQQQQQQQQQHQQQNSLNGLPDGWEQAVTSEGEVYYINHQTKTTSWFHPCQTMQSMSPNAPMNIQNMQFLKQQQQQQQQQKFLLQQQQQQQQQQRNPQMDPLLNHNSMLSSLVREKYGNANALQMNSVGIHGRVESADSGLDGMGTLLTSSSDMEAMNTMDDVDMEGNQPLNAANQNQDIRLNRGLPECFDSMQGTNVDLGILENESGFDGMSNDILSDVDLNPTWL